MKRAMIVDVGGTTVKWRTWERGGTPGPVKRSGYGWARRDALLVAQAFEAEALILVASSPVRGEEIEIEAEGAGIKVLRPRRDFPVAMETEYRDPAQLGVDRLLQAYAATGRMGAPVVTCSVGTCLTMEAVDKRGVLVGGAIAAGLRAMLAGVASAAPHLPVLADLPAAGLGGDGVGRSTEENLSIGIWFSLGASVDRLAELGRFAVGADAPVVLTGGDADRAMRYCRAVTRIVPDLVLEGAARALDDWVEAEAQ